MIIVGDKKYEKIKTGSNDREDEVSKEGFDINLDEYTNIPSDIKRHMLTKIVHCYIDKNPLKINDYVLSFKYIEKVSDYWKREQTPRYEMHIAKINLVLNESNNSMFTKDDVLGFDKFLKENMIEYFLQVAKTRTNIIRETKNFSTIEDIMEDKTIKRDYKILGIYGENNIKSKIEGKIQKAY